MSSQWSAKKDWVSTTATEVCRSTTTRDDAGTLTCALDAGHEERSKHQRLHNGQVYQW